jgi:dihydrofolate reductase
MSTIVVSEFVTVDGVMEDPGGAEGFRHGGWAFRFDRGADGDRFKLEELQAAGALLLGRRTYEGFAAVWPSVTDEQGFAEKMNSMPKYVVSSTLEEASWANSTILRGDLAEAVEHVQRESDGDVLVAGSATLVQGLAELDLVDRYRLMVFPIVLGTGKRLFRETADAAALRLVEARPAGAVVTMVLERDRGADG